MTAISDRVPLYSKLNLFVRSPRFFIGIQMIAVLIVGSIIGLLQVIVASDSIGYINISKMPLPEMMGSCRTIAYPLLVRVIASVSPNYVLMPWIHLSILFFSVYFFDYALRRYGASPWQAFAASCGFFYAATNYLIRALLTDFLAQIMAIISVSCLFLLVCNKHKYKIWCALGFSLMVSYHLRPDYLFLIPFIPCLGVLLLWFRKPWASEPFQWKAFFTGLCGVSILPYLGYCLLRWYVVGQFGLVSLAGWVSSGFAVEFLDEKMVETELSDRYRPLAREMLQKRQEIGIPYAFHGRWVINMRQWQMNVNKDVQEIAKPIATEMYGHNIVAINRELGNFSREVIGLRKGNYMLLFAYGWLWATAKLLGKSLAIQVLLSLSLLLWFMRKYVSTKLSFRPLSEKGDTREIMLLRALLCAAILFFLGKVFSGVLVTFVDSRYVIPAGTLFSSYLALFSFRELKIIHAIRDMYGAKNAAKHTIG
jgi:hypothetical protein